MVVEGRLEFGHQGLADTGIAYHDHWLELMPEATKEFLLMFAEIHGCEV